MIDHIGIAVKNAEEAEKSYTALGFRKDGEEVVESQGVRVTFLHAGNTHVELLEPLGENSPVFKSIEKRGEGLHHLCVRVENVRNTMEKLTAAGKKMIYEEPVPGAGGRPTNFIHPSSSGGVLLEIQEDHDPGT